MTQPFPVSDFKRVDVNDEDLHYYYNTPGKGLIREVDLEYPERLHKLHSILVTNLSTREKSDIWSQSGHTNTTVLGIVIVLNNLF